MRGRGAAINVNDAAQVEAVVAGIQEQHGEIAILVNNAGITRDNLLARMKEDEWDAIMATNLKSVYRLARLVLRQRRKKAPKRACHHEARAVLTPVFGPAPTSRND